MISTAPYQSGALDFAITHGIALATVTEGRFTLATRAKAAAPPISRAEALEKFGVPTYVAYYYGPGHEPGSVLETLLSSDYPEYIGEMLTGHPVDNPSEDDNRSASAT
jgi:hypothetical protein